MSLSRIVCRGVVFAFGLIALPAFGQPLHGNEGPGIKLGSSLVGHVGVGVETAFDSNVFYTDTDETADAQSAPFLRLVPHFALSTLSPQRGGDSPSQKVAFRLGTSIGLRRYISDNENIADNGGVDVNADLRLTLNPAGAVAFAIYDNFMRTSQTRNFESPEPSNRFGNQVGGKLTLHPGGGALATDLGYDFNQDVFEDEFSGGLDAGATWHRFYGGLRWKLLPKTAVSLDGEGRIYKKEDDTGALSDSVHERGYFGFETLWTPRFGTVSKVGLGHASYDEGDDSTQFVAILNLNWYFPPRGQLTLGYERNVADSIFSNTFVDDLAYLTYRHAIGDRLSIGARPGFRHRKYGGLPDELLCTAASTEACYPEAERSDNIFELDANLDFRITEWFFAGIAYFMQLDSTDFAIQDPTTGALDETNSFTKHVFMGRLEATY